MNRTSTSALAIYRKSKQNDWDNCIQTWVYAINTSVQDIKKVTPFYSKHGHHKTLPAETALIKSKVKGMTK